MAEPLDYSKFPLVVPGEEKLSEPSEHYFRECPPRGIDHLGNVTEQVFVLSSEDDGKLSGARSTKCAPRESHEFREALRPGASIGTLALTIAEVESAGLRAVDDSALLGEAAVNGHTYLDFRPIAGGGATHKQERQRIRSRLLIRVANRGFAYRPH